jgi:hypothetical protein
MSNIPDARYILEVLIYAMENGLGKVKRKDIIMGIKDALGLMTRRSAVRRTEEPPEHSPKLSKKQKKKVRKLHAEGKSQAQIARKITTNSGRVSEVVNPPPKGAA